MPPQGVGAAAGRSGVSKGLRETGEEIKAAESPEAAPREGAGRFTNVSGKRDTWKLPGPLINEEGNKINDDDKNG